MPAEPNRCVAQAEAIEITTNSTAKVAAVVSSSGLAGALAGPHPGGAAPAGPVPCQRHGQTEHRQHQQRRRQCQRKVTVEHEDDDQQAEVHHRVASTTPASDCRTADASSRARRASTKVVAVDEYEAAEQSHQQAGAARRDIALQQVAGVRHGADRDHRQPHLVRRDRREVGHRRVRQQRQHEPGEQQEAPGVDDLGQLDAAREAVQFLCARSAAARPRRWRRSRPKPVRQARPAPADRRARCRSAP